MHLKCVRVTPNQKFGVATLHRSSLSRELQGLKAALQHLHPLPTNSLPPLSSSLRPNPSLGPDASASGSPLGYRRPDDSIFPRGMPSTVFPGGSDGILPPPGMSNHKGLQTQALLPGHYLGLQPFVMCSTCAWLSVLIVLLDMTCNP